MFVKQVSVFVENKSGKTADVIETLGKNDIDIRALSIADTTDFGILRLIVNKPEEAEKLLKEDGFVVRLTDVIAVGLEDKPGSLSRVLNVLKEYEVEIEYIYAFIGKSKYGALVIMKPEDSEKALNVLNSNNIAIANESELF